jgi:hypothetical protein
MVVYDELRMVVYEYIRYRLCPGCDFTARRRWMTTGSPSLRHQTRCCHCAVTRLSDAPFQFFLTEAYGTVQYVVSGSLEVDPLDPDPQSALGPPTAPSPFRYFPCGGLHLRCEYNLTHSVSSVDTWCKSTFGIVPGHCRVQYLSTEKQACRTGCLL